MFEQPNNAPNKPLHRAKLLTVVFLFLLSTSAGFMGGWFGSRSHQTDLSNQKQVISSESTLISEIAKEVGPSVVSVNVTSQVAATPQTIFSEGSAAGQQQSAGTGFIVSSDGVIVTNRHVVPAGTTSVNVVLSDGTKLDKVSVIGRTSDNDSLDLAFLKINDAKGKTLQPAKLGDSTKMQVGAKVVAIGNALGEFRNTVTSGIISGFGRQVQAGDSSGTSTEDLQDLFQTDAAINEGNSGGPLVNIDGEVIGINTAIAGGAQNIGFAIPVNDVMTIIKGVLKTGKLERAYLGVRYVAVTDEYAALKNLPTKRGAYIVPGEGAVVAGGPAAKAGLQEGDIITKVNGTTIDEDNSLSTVLGRFSVGQKVSLSIVRGGKPLSVSVVPGNAPN